MKLSEKKRLRREFLDRLGPVAEVLRQMMDVVPDVGFYIKDLEGRIMAINKRNCEYCNIKREMDAIGKRSCDLFPAVLAEAFMKRDRTVLRTRKPLVIEDYHTADHSNTHNFLTIFPLEDAAGEIIGTSCVYFRKPNAINPGIDWRSRLNPTLEYTARHYSEDITTRTLADLVSMSETNFRRQFSATFGISPGRYITQIRLNAARQLLETTDKSIAEIANETGFWDQSHFTKAFKLSRRMTPGEYRRQHRTGQV